ncbi:MAG: tetratricopeptide repeat protein [Saprospiraceae bacterium]|nr:tetratricopeptide repeat protein [Saprospiraceae bacterium]
MNNFYHKTYFLTLFFCLILRGVSWADVEPSNAFADADPQVANKDVQQIIELANRYSFKDLNLSLAYINLALEKAKAQGDLRQVYNAQREMGFIYQDNMLTKRSISAFQEALKTAESASPSLSMWADSAFAEIYNDLAIENRKMGNYRLAYDYYDKTIEVAQRTKDYEMVASSYHGLGILHKEIGVYDRAINYFLKSLEISAQIGSKIDVIISHNEIADAYLKAKEIEKALIHIEKGLQNALAFEKEQPKTEKANAALASILNRYGEILVAQRDYDAALKKHEAALAVYQGINFKSYIAHTLLLLANIYLEKEQYDTAEQKYRLCIQYESQFFSRDLADLYFKFGVLKQKQNKPREAQLAYYKSLQSAKRYDFKDIAQKASYQLFLIYLNADDKNQALAYLNVANALNDSLFNVEKARRTAEMELKFDIEKRENEIHQFRLRENRFMLIGSIAAFLMLVIFLAYTIRTHSRNVKALESKNDEIQQQYKKLEESNEILSQFAYVDSARFERTAPQHR